MARGGVASGLPARVDVDARHPAVPPDQEAVADDHAALGLVGRDLDEPEYGYPYAAEDSREASETAADLRRVVRGGSWNLDLSFAQSVRVCG